MATASVEARAIFLADKLHNLLSIQIDLEEGRPVWTAFNAERSRVLWYYESAIQAAGSGDPRLERLASECRRILDAFREQPA
jgi:(p)ppGpp synthase/HD superfamily hydrolase